MCAPCPMTKQEDGWGTMARTPKRIRCQMEVTVLQSLFIVLLFLLEDEFEWCKYLCCPNFVTCFPQAWLKSFKLRPEAFDWAFVISENLRNKMYLKRNPDCATMSIKLLGWLNRSMRQSSLGCLEKTSNSRNISNSHML